MKTEEELNADILKTTMIIRDNFPELSKYISEMPITIPNEKNPEISLKNLADYSNSLSEILKKYAPTHTN